MLCYPAGSQASIRQNRGYYPEDCDNTAQFHVLTVSQALRFRSFAATYSREAPHLVHMRLSVLSTVLCVSVLTKTADTEDD